MYNFFLYSRDQSHIVFPTQTILDSTVPSILKSTSTIETPFKHEKSIFTQDINHMLDSLSQKSNISKYDDDLLNPTKK